MELRLQTACATKDIDLSMLGQSQKKDQILERLQVQAANDLGDGFVFTIGVPQKHLDGPPDGGYRFPVASFIAGRVFTKFHLDVGISDALVRPTEITPGRDWLGFVGISLCFLHRYFEGTTICRKTSRLHPPAPKS